MNPKRKICLVVSGFISLTTTISISLFFFDEYAPLIASFYSCYIGLFFVMGYIVRTIKKLKIYLYRIVQLAVISACVYIVLFSDNVQENTDLQLLMIIIAEIMNEVCFMVINYLEE